MASRKIEDLHSKMQGIAQEFLINANIQLGEFEAFITDGYRSNEEQTELYASGRTKPGNILTYAKAGQSPHNYGLAIDIAFRHDGTKEAIWDINLYKKLAQLALSLGLVWGGTWEMRDNPHYELENWRDIIKQQEQTPMPDKELMQIEIKDFEKLMKEAKEKDEIIARNNIQINDLEGKIRDLNFEKDKLAKELESCQIYGTKQKIDKEVKVAGQDWVINGIRVDSNGLIVGNYSKK